MKETKYFAGIGSRETPQEILKTMFDISSVLTTNGYILRSGSAPGADQSFEKGVLNNNKQIFLPWKNFENNKSTYYTISEEAYELAKKYHPRFTYLSQGAKKLIARNGYIILGYNLKEPVEFVVCWTPNGKITGGTGQGLRIANDLEIPIYNLFHLEDRNKIYEIIYKNV